MTAQHLTEQYRALPLEAQRQVDEFVAGLRQKHSSGSDGESVRLAALERLHGALEETGLELDDFLNERRADVERENSRDES